MGCAPLTLLLLAAYSRLHKREVRMSSLKRHVTVRTFQNTARLIIAMVGMLAASQTPAQIHTDGAQAPRAPASAAGLSTLPPVQVQSARASASDETDVVYSDTSLTACPVGEKLKYFYYWSDTPDFRGSSWCGAAQADLDWANANDANRWRIPYLLEQCVAGSYWTYSHAFPDGSRFYSPQYRGITMVCTKRADPPEVPGDGPPPTPPSGPPSPPTPPPSSGPSSPPPMCGPSGNAFGNPVTPATGNKTQDSVDVIVGAAHPLQWVSMYRSLHANSIATSVLPNTGMSPGWTHNHAATLQPAGNAGSWPDGAEQTLMLAGGQLVRFAFNAASGQWVHATPTRRLSLQGAVWRYTDADSDRALQFDPAGRLQSTIERNGWTTTYGYAPVNGTSRLASVTSQFGRSLSLSYNPWGQLISTSTAAGVQASYEYDGSRRLVRVRYADNTSKTYLYENSAYIYALTGIIDENNQRLATYAYDGAGRAISTEHAGGVERYQVTYPAVSGGATTVTDPLGTLRSFTYAAQSGKLAVTGGDKPDGLGQPDAASRVQTPLGLITSETDFLGASTTYQWDTVRRLPTSTTEAAGTPDARTTTTTWHPQWRLPVTVTEVGRETSYTYDSQSNPLTQTIKDTSVIPVHSRTWSWTYHPSGLVATETDPNGAVTSYAYDSAGNLTQSTNALNRVDSYTHDGAGRVLTHTAPTGLVTTYTYDARGRMLTTNRGGLLTTFTYRPSGQVATARTAAGYQVTYSYDAAQRLIGWSDNRSASATYTLDGMGNRVNESILDAQGQATWSVARTINSLNRIESITMGSAATATPSSTGYGYDANGELISSTQTVGGANQVTSLGLDALRRVKTITSAQNASAALVYNAQDAVTQATDFKSVATNYTRDALGNAKQEATPDSGTLTSTYDSLGLPQSITDALGRATSITRDALGRPTQITSSLGGANQTTLLHYDLPGTDYNTPGALQASIGYLSEIQDPGATTRYQRDPQGRVVRKVQALANGDTRSTAYAYVPVGSNGAGQIASTTYPSGKQLTHQYDATGQLTGLTWAGQPLITNLAWNPLGQPTAWQWPSFVSGPNSTEPLAELRSYTSAGQLSGSALLDLTWDSAGRISQITQQHMLPGTGASAQQATLTSAYAYDPIGRLTASAHSGPPGLTLPTGWSLSDTIGPNATGYAWDANGNRTQVHYSTTTLAGTATLQRAYQTTSGSNRLSGYTQTYQAPGSSAQTSTVTYSQDAAGALIKKGDNHLHYAVDGRIAKVGLNANASNALALSYTYNILGQRLLKSDARLSGTAVPPVTQQTVYAEDGIGSTVLGNYSNRRSTDSAAPAGEMDSTEVIYLPTASGPIPMAAQINGRLYAIDSDHLNTPRRLTNQQGQVTWQWLVTGFGEVPPTTGAQGFAQSGSSQSYSEQVTFDLRYPGQQWDEETGLAYNLHRYYDAATGRYVQADPIGLEGGFNRFGYVNGDPLRQVDPRGLCPFCLAIPLVAGGITATDIAVGVAGAGALVGLDRLLSSGLPPGFIPGDKGAEQWGRNNGIAPNDARGRFHGIKQSDKGRGRDKYGVNPQTGEVCNPDGDVVGDLGDAPRK